VPSVRTPSCSVMVSSKRSARSVTHATGLDGLHKRESESGRGSGKRPLWNGCCLLLLLPRLTWSLAARPDASNTCHHDLDQQVNSRGRFPASALYLFIQSFDLSASQYDLFDMIDRAFIVIISIRANSRLEKANDCFRADRKWSLVVHLFTRFYGFMAPN
jgi:hypothetical protein